MSSNFSSQIFFFLFKAFALGETGDALDLDVGAELLGYVCDITGNIAVKQVGTDKCLLEKADFLDLLLDTTVNCTGKNLVLYELILACDCKLGERSNSFLGQEVEQELVVFLLLVCSRASLRKPC